MNHYEKDGFAGEAIQYKEQENKLTLLEYKEKQARVKVPSHINGVEVWYLSRTFIGNKTVEEVVVPQGVKIIGDETFLNCTGLKRVVLPTSLHFIGQKAFRQCTNLEEVVVPEGVNTIGDEVFLGCTGLKRVVLPASIGVIGQKVFRQCPNLEEVVLLSPEGVEIQRNTFDFGGYPWNEEGNLILGTVLFYTSSEEAVRSIPEGVTMVKKKAIFARNTLKELHFPDSVTEIEAGAFEACDHLEKVVLPKGLKKIPEKAFRNTALKKIKIPSPVEELGEYCFKGCKQLSKVVFEKPSSLKVIGSFAFLECNLQGIVIPTSVERMEEGAFASCKSLVKVKLPSKITVKKSAFASCDSLVNVKLPLKSKVEKGAFPYPDTMELLQPLLVESFSQWEQNDYYKKHFYRWSQLTPTEQRQLKKGITLLLQQWDVCLKGEESGKVSFLTELFEHKTEVEMTLFFQLGFTLTLAELETYLRDATQKGKGKITAFLLEKKKEWFTTQEMEAYEIRKEQVEIGLELPTLEELGRKWFLQREAHGVRVTGYRGGDGVEMLPSVTVDGVKVLGVKSSTSDNSFKGLTFLKLSEGMELGECAFRQSVLEEIQIPSPMRVIPDYCFLDAELEKVTLPEGLEEIGKYAFGENSLEEIVLPSTLKSMDCGCFSNCSGLKRVIFRESMEALSKKNDREGNSTRPRDGSFTGCTSLEFVGIEGGENQLERLKEEGIISS